MIKRLHRMSIQFSFPEDEYQEKRERMVRQQMEHRGIHDERVLAALRAVPRHRFTPLNQASSAYEDYPLSIGNGQTISQPYIVAYMSEALDLQPEDLVLEIGTGSGYQSAVLACLAAHVFSVERDDRLAESARTRLTELHFDNVDVRTGDGTLGWPEHAPYNAVLITAGTPDVPPPLLEQLAPKGRLLAPVGDRSVQQLELWRLADEGFEKRSLISVVFVPLVGRYGW